MEEGLNLTDIFKISSGMLDEGEFASAVSINVVKKLEGEDVLPIRNVYLKAPVYIYGEGGCVVVTATFPSKELGNCMQAVTACRTWLHDRKDTQLMMTIVPMVFDGADSLVVMLQNLVFCDHYRTGKGEGKLILCFDNDVTTLMTTGNLGVEEIRKTVDLRLKQEQDALEKEIAMLEREEKELQEKINSQQYIPDYNTLTFETKEGEENLSGFRSVKEKSAIQVAEEEEDLS